MAQTIEECLNYLAAAEKSVGELSEAADREAELKQKENQIRKQLEAEKKQMADAVGSTVKKRREEITSSYDSEINKAQDQLKKARSKREKAKTQGMKERIEEETSALHEHNRELVSRMKAKFREFHAPAWCRSRLYYSLYMPRWAKEFLGLFLFVALLFVALPFGVYAALPQHKTWYLALIYVADIVVFGGIYMWIGNHTKLQYAECLKEGRQILDQMHANNKKIKVITGIIRKDRNESLYDLEKYDDEIARLTQELNEVAAKKKDALNTFETVTRNILQDEIEHGHREKIAELELQYEAVRRELQLITAEVKARRLTLTDQYGSHLGKEFLDPVKLQDLSTILQQGRATNISEAIGVYQEEKEKN